MELKREKSLRRLFIEFIVWFCFIAIVMGGICFSVFSVLLKAEVIYPANYQQVQIEKKRVEITNASKITKDMIPIGCSYGVYRLSGEMLTGNFTKKESIRAWEAVKKNENVLWRGHYAAIIYNPSGVCVIAYTLSAQFSNSFLQKKFLRPETLLSLSFFISLLIEVLFLSAYFGKILAREMKKLTGACEKIKKHDLDFSMEYSSIIEMQDVNVSLHQVKDALKDSLEKQWSMEEMRKSQISALAHDIKTPLTIIRGNAELNQETTVDEEMKTCNEAILKNADEIERYMAYLIEMTNSEDMMSIRTEELELESFIERIITQAKSLMPDKGVKILYEKRTLPKVIEADEELLYRAIINVFTNAIRYAPVGGKVVFSSKVRMPYIEFQVSDNGMGFSKMDLLSATKQFYRSDASRSEKGHYGIGLYITESFIKLHRGRLMLSNSPEIGGATVTMLLPIARKKVRD